MTEIDTVRNNERIDYNIYYENCAIIVTGIIGLVIFLYIMNLIADSFYSNK